MLILATLSERQKEEASGTLNKYYAGLALRKEPTISEMYGHYILHMHDCGVNPTHRYCVGDCNSCDGSCKAHPILA